MKIDEVLVVERQLMEVAHGGSASPLPAQALAP